MVVAVLCLVVFTGFLNARGFWPILLVMLPAAVRFQPMIPLAESQTMAVVLRDRACVTEPAARLRSAPRPRRAVRG